MASDRENMVYRDVPGGRKAKVVVIGSVTRETGLVFDGRQESERTAELARVLEHYLRAYDDERSLPDPGFNECAGVRDFAVWLAVTLTQKALL